MMVEKISSKTNEKIKLAVCVRESAGARKKNALFFLEGARLCADAAGCTNIRYAFATAQAREKYSQYITLIEQSAQSFYEITPEIAKKLSDTNFSQGIFCLCEILDADDNTNVIDPHGRYIILENIQDPSNLGAISRTAEALGIDGIISSGGCERYNPKALRASMGSLLRLPYFHTGNLEGFITHLREKGINVYASVPDSSANNITKLNLHHSSCVVIGNEGSGVSEEIISLCSQKITIPMQDSVQSLNAATAAAIVMWEMMR